MIARLADIDVAHPEISLSDRLSQWIDWTRAVALSRALDPAPPAAGIDAETNADTGTRHDADIGATDDVDDCIRARSSLAAAIANETMALGDGAAAGPAELRKRYLGQQRAMQAVTGRLRGRLRDRLAARSADMARLAEVDAVMELVLSPKEHALLATVPDLLGAHFERLQHGVRGDATATDETAAHASDAWLDRFRKDMQDVLLAELDVRFQPIEGLLAALHPHRQWTS